MIVSSSIFEKSYNYKAISGRYAPVYVIFIYLSSILHMSCIKTGKNWNCIVRDQVVDVLTDRGMQLRANSALSWWESVKNEVPEELKVAIQLKLRSLFPTFSRILSFLLSRVCAMYFCFHDPLDYSESRLQNFILPTLPTLINYYFSIYILFVNSQTHNVIPNLA